MQVFCEPDHSADVECRDSADFSHVSFCFPLQNTQNHQCVNFKKIIYNSGFMIYSQVDNTYATIQHPNRRGSHDIADDGGNYATLRGTDSHGNHRDVR